MNSRANTPQSSEEIAILKNRIKELEHAEVKHKRAEEALQKSEAKYRELLELAQEGVWVIDKDSNTTFANLSMARMLGYTPDEMQGKHLFSFMDEQGVEISTKNLERRRRGIKEQHDFEFIRKDGHRILTTIETAPVLDEAGNYNGAIAGVIETTERKQSEKALRESEERYRTLVESTCDGVAISNGEGELIFANSSYVSMFGYSSPDELIGTLAVDRYANPEDRTGIFKRLSKDGYAESVELDMLKKDGARISVLCSAVLRQDKSGNIIQAEATVTDITERKKTEEALRSSEELYRNVFNNSPLGIIHFDTNGVVTDCNDEFIRIMDSTREKSVGLNMLKQVRDQIALAAIISTLETGFGYYNDYYTSLTSQKATPLVIHFRAIHNFKNEIIGGVGILEDITERKQAEQALKDSEERFRSLIESTADGIITADQSGNITLWNNGAQNMFGYRIDEIIGKPITEIMPESYRTSHDENMQRLVKTGKAKHMAETLELEGLRKDGSVFPLELSLSTWRSQEIRFFAAIARDISDRKEAEKTLRQSDERLRMALRNTAITVFSQDKDLRYTWAYNMSREFNAATILGKTDAELVTAGDAKMPMAVKRRVLQTGKGTRVEASYIKDGRTGFYELMVEPLFNTIGEIVGVNCLSIDITERKRAEEEKAKLEEQARRSKRLETIGTLAGGIAHDFNNILTPILGYADMALSDPSLSNLLREDLEHILRGATRAKDLVEQILLFSRKTEKERQPLRLHLIVKEAQKLLRPSIPTTIEIRQRIDASCDKILADATQMHEVVVNLCTNAWQAMEAKGGTLTIELKQVKVNAATAKVHSQLNEQEYVRLSVSDTGTGMDDATLERLFEPFFTTKAVDKGTGMGLAVVHGIVASHHGDIHVDSEPGKGSTFQVYLPTVSAAQAEAFKKGPGAIQGGHESILVVDDELVVAKVVKRMLERLGYEVEVCNSSIEALKTFRQQPDKYDLMISDLTMPDMTGLVLAEELRKIRPKFSTIIMTGYGEGLPEDSLEHYGIQEVIGKPIIIRELAGGIRNVLDK